MIKKIRTLIVSIYYNRSNMVDESISSVVKQLDPQDVLLLVDDGSSDTTLEELKRFEDNNIVVVSYENSGFTSSVSRAIASIESEYVAIHGAGDLSLPGRFSAQAEILENQPDVGLVGTWYEDYDITNNNSTIVGKALNAKESTLMAKCNPFGHSTVMFRRKIYNTVGGYRSFFTFAQDRDLWCRMSRHCNFHQVEKPFVRRYKYVEGAVSEDYKKALRQRYLSDFAVFMHTSNLNEYVTVNEACLYFRPSMEVKVDLFKRSLRALSDNKPEVLQYYKKHILQGKGNVFAPFYLGLKFFPKSTQSLCKRILKK